MTLLDPSPTSSLDTSVGPKSLEVKVLIQKEKNQIGYISEAACHVHGHVKGENLGIPSLE